MADIDYPCALPGVLVNSNAYSPSNQVLRNDLASGPPVFVLQTDDGFVPFDVAWSYSALDMQVFRNWFRNTLVNGSKLFNIDLYVEGPDGEGNQTQPHECYFDGTYNAVQQGRRWSVTARLLAIDESHLDLCDTESLIAAYNGFGGDYLSAGIGDLDEAIQLMEQLWAA